jgi:hypothetical protein
MSSATMIATIASAVGTGLSAIGAYQQSKATKSQMEYNAAIQRNNSITAQYDAEAIRERGKEEEADHRDRIRQTIGDARAGQAAGMFLIDDKKDSTNVQLIGDLAEAGELDILRLRDDVELRARAREIEASNFDSQAGLFDMSAAAQSPFLAGATTLLSGAAATAGVYAKGQGLTKTGGGGTTGTATGKPNLIAFGAARYR